MSKPKKTMILCLLSLIIVTIFLLNVEYTKKEGQKNYNAQIDEDGSNLVSEQSVTTEENVTSKDNLQIDNYTSTESQYNGKTKENINASNKEKESNNKKQSENTHKKEEIKKEVYTVIFNTNGGSEVGEQTIIKDGMIHKPNNPTKDGYVFINWTLDNKEYNFNTKVTNNITLTANWGLLGDVNNDNILNTKDTIYLKRYLANWDVEISLINADVNLDGEIDDIDLAIITRYHMNEIDKLPYEAGEEYTIKFNLNGGIFEEKEYVPKKYASITGPIQYAEFSVIKEGYVFIGWTGSNGNVLQKSIKIEKDTIGNLEYNANWLLYGDVTNDNKVDIGDSILIQQYIEGTSELTKSQKLGADVNLDSKVDDIDVKIIRDYLANKIDKLPYTS